MVESAATAKAKPTNDEEKKDNGSRTINVHTSVKTRCKIPDLQSAKNHPKVQTKKSFTFSYSYVLNMTIL